MQGSVCGPVCKRRFFAYKISITGAKRPDLPPWPFKNSLTCAERPYLHTWIQWREQKRRFCPRGLTHEKYHCWLVTIGTIASFDVLFWPASRRQAVCLGGTHSALLRSALLPSPASSLSRELVSGRHLPLPEAVGWPRPPWLTACLATLRHWHKAWTAQCWSFRQKMVKCLSLIVLCYNIIRAERHLLL